MNRAVSASLTILCLLSISSITGLIQIVNQGGGTAYIQANGSITPPTAPIYTADNITYTLTGNITDYASGIVIERDNITVDGAGYTVQGGRAIYMDGRSNVTIENMTIGAFDVGIWLWSSSGNIISGNNITNNGDNIVLDSSSNNAIYHNNFINNTGQVSSGSINVWDDGYPSGGNYWSNYITKYPNATETDGSGVWNTPYVIDTNNIDHYPLMVPYAIIPEFPSIQAMMFFMLLTLLIIIIYKKKDVKTGQS